jgi:hypothetical protein
MLFLLKSILFYKDASFKRLGDSLKTSVSVERLGQAIVTASENLRLPLSLIGIAAILGSILFGAAALIKALIGLI